MKYPVNTIFDTGVQMLRVTGMQSGYYHTVSDSGIRNDWSESFVTHRVDNGFWIALPETYAYGDHFTHRDGHTVTIKGIDSDLFGVTRYHTLALGRQDTITPAELTSALMNGYLRYVPKQNNGKTPKGSVTGRPAGSPHTLTRSRLLDLLTEVYRQGALDHVPDDWDIEGALIEQLDRSHDRIREWLNDLLNEYTTP